MVVNVKVSFAEDRIWDIGDVASAIYFLINNHTFGEKYNIVANEESDNLELALKISKIMNKKLNYQLVDPKITRPRHDFRYSLCGEKLRSMGWKQEVDLEEGLQKTVSWILENEINK